jgi:hypothetical protein
VFVTYTYVVFARIYLLCRLIMIHSHLVRNASSQSLGYLNQVSINFFFLVKTYLDRWPVRCLFTFCLLLFIVGSWSLRACNYTSTGEHVSMLDSMWLFIVTFTTVGRYPCSYDYCRHIEKIIQQINVCFNRLR